MERRIQDGEDGGQEAQMEGVCSEKAWVRKIKARECQRTETT